MLVEKMDIHGPWIDRLARHLAVETYSQSAKDKRMTAGRQFLLYLDSRGIDVATATHAHEQAFLNHKLEAYRERHGSEPGDVSAWRWGYTGGVHMLMRIVQGGWPPAATDLTPPEAFHHDLCNDYVRWLAEVRGLSGTTIPNRRAEAQRFLEALGERGGDRVLLAGTTVGDLDQYVMSRSAQLRRASRQQLVNYVRGFLRYLHNQGLIKTDLSGAIMSPSRYSLEGIPPALRAEHVDAVLKAAEKDHTAKGLRDYAILLLLATYGLRAGEVTALRLEDLDWRKDRLRIRHSKTGHESVLPLLATVGESILRYLQAGRPQSRAREVFLRVRAPFHRLGSGSSLYHMVEYRLHDAGVKLDRKHGPHAFRHARAVGLLEAGVSMKSIGDVLGHRSTESTSIYLKLAIPELRSIGLELPVGVTR